MMTPRVVEIKRVSLIVVRTPSGKTIALPNKKEM